MNTIKQNGLRRLALFGGLLVLECLLGFTNLGFIKVSPVAITTLHLPVIIGGIVLGPAYGGLLGGAFGLISMVRATSEGVSKIDLMFSPFVSGQPVASLVMCILPRILLGVAAGFLYLLFSRAAARKGNLGIGLSAGLSALLSTILHTVVVMSCLYLFFSAIPLSSVFSTIVTLNGALEILVAVVVAVPVSILIVRYFSPERGDAPASAAGAG